MRLCILKSGNIGASPLLEFLLDERADRENFDVTVFGTGSKIVKKKLIKFAEEIIESKPDLVLLVFPNASSRIYDEVINLFSQSNLPTIIISDGAGKKISEKINGKLNLGYIIVTGDPIIGARREFLDPVEMVIFNADVLKVLSITGALSLIYQTLDKVVEDIRRGVLPDLPKIIIDGELAINSAGFNNPYAKCKAFAAYLIAEKVAKVNFEGCFKITDWERYVTTVAAGHEMMRVAAKLVDEAREIEKAEDKVTRRPHGKDGRILEKKKLFSKPK